ncbi:MAG: nuclear transport factor 2 family protein [Myxococcota bacterium]
MEKNAQTLIHLEEIKQLKARYFRLMDTKQWADFALVFAEEAEIDVTEDVDSDEGRVRGREQIADFIRDAVQDARTVHHGHMPEITLTGPDTAEGIWAMYDYLEFPSEPGQSNGLHGYGHYHEKYVYRDGRWQIASMRLSRLRVDRLN